MEWSGQIQARSYSLKGYLGKAMDYIQMLSIPPSCETGYWLIGDEAQGVLLLNCTDYSSWWNLCPELTNPFEVTVERTLRMLKLKSRFHLSPQKPI